MLKDLTSAEFKTAAGDKTVINGDGLTVTDGKAGLPNPATPGATNTKWISNSTRCCGRIKLNVGWKATASAVGTGVAFRKPKCTIS